MSVNTDQKRLRDVAVSEDTVDSFVCSFDEEVQDRMEEETVEEVIYREQEEIVDKGNLLSSVMVLTFPCRARSVEHDLFSVMSCIVFVHWSSFHP
jgi:hypothetical protein